MKVMKEVLLFLAFVSCLVSVHAQSSTGVAAANGKKLVAIQPLPVFCLAEEFEIRKQVPGSGGGGSAAQSPGSGAGNAGPVGVGTLQGPLRLKTEGQPCGQDEFELKTGNGSDLAKLTSGSFTAGLLGTDWIAIYCTKPEVCGTSQLGRDDVGRDLQALKDKIGDGAAPDLKFSQLIEVPTGQASAIVQKISGKGSSITLTAVDGSTIQLASDSFPSRDDFDAVRNRIRLLGWDREVSPPTQRLFELDAGTVAKCLGASGCPDSGSKGQAGDNSDSTKNADSKNAGNSNDNGNGGTGTPDQAQGGKTKAGNGAQQDNSGGSTGSKNQSGNNGTTGGPSNPASGKGGSTGQGSSGGNQGGGRGNSTGGGKKAGNGGKKSSGQATYKGQELGPKIQPVSMMTGSAKNSTSGGKSRARKAEGTQNQSSGTGGQNSGNTTNDNTGDNPPPDKPDAGNPKGEAGSSGPDIKSVADMLVFSNGDGSDKGIWEKHRLITILDLPRPEVLMNVWSFQASSGDPQRVKREFEEIRQTVAEHNEALQSAIQYGWDYLSRNMGCWTEPNQKQRNSDSRSVHGDTSGMEAQEQKGVPEESSQQDSAAKTSTAECVTRNAGFFDEGFYNYITQRFVDDCVDCDGIKQWKDAGVIQPRTLKTDFNICGDGRYCLGYAHAFDPVRPSLTNIILTMIASKEPEKTAIATAVCMEGNWDPDDAKGCFPFRKDFSEILDSVGKVTANAKQGKEDARDSKVETAQGKPARKEGKKTVSERELERLKNANRLADQYKEELTEKNDSRAKDIAKCIQGTLAPASVHFDCELQDRLALNIQLETGLPQTLQLSCFKAQIAESMLSLDDVSTFRGDDISGLSRLSGQDFNTKYSTTVKTRHAAYATTRIRLLRAAIADFLFNYKMATQYPHDFVPYDLDQSAQELNAQLNPLIVAFNRDVAAFTQHLQDELSCKFPDATWPKGTNWFKDIFAKQKNTFLNNGEITVRGISGVESVVNTITQSYFDATKPPSITDLVNSVSDAETKIPGVLKSNLTANEASVIIGALNSVKPAQAKIGREFDVDITPHTLAGASSAELDVKLTVQESADPTLFTGDKSSEDALSRVGKHNTTTKVRVDSLKLFEVSSFSALLQRPKSKFPLVPPLFEVPYFGSFIGIPIPGAKEYHRSTAIVSAIIVPTAFDLAYGIDFTGDRVCERTPSAVYPDAPKYECHHALSLGDLHRLPIRNFHKKLVECFASASRCGSGGAAGIKFANVPPAD